MTTSRSEARAREVLADVLSEPGCSSPAVDATLVREGATATVMVAADDALAAIQVAFTEPAAAMPGVDVRATGQRLTFTEEVAVRGRLVDQCEQAETRGDKRTTAEVRDIRAILALTPSHSGETGEVERLREALEALRQYRNDMLFPPAPDSRERRIAMIDAAIRKMEAA